jgi:capsid protein
MATSAQSSNEQGLLDRLHRRLREACDALWDRCVDPRDDWLDDVGTRWLPLAADGPGASLAAGPSSEAQLRDIRNQCRVLALENEFAINGHENRISYIVGCGHTYRATLRKGHRAPPEWAAAVQAVLDDFLSVNAWHGRQPEIVRRRDRDGEAFLRFFAAADGTLRVRFVEPDLIATPPHQAGNSAARLGVLTEPHDVETPLAYFVDGQPIDAADIQHRKANVDRNARRGLPLFFPVRKNLRRAEKLLRNMSVVAEIQSAIALIRRHPHASRGSVEQFVAGAADRTTASPASRRAATYRRYGPGTILDVPGGVEYDFPAAGLDAANFVRVLQAELRAIASRLVMPEFMLTSDASNANYSSTMIAEGPAMRMFSRLQAEMIADDLEVMWRAVRAAVAAGKLPRGVLAAIEIQAAAPSLAVRDALQETQRRRIEHAAGILSPQTWSQLCGLDYDQEQANLAAHRAAPSTRGGQKPRCPG